MKDHNQQGAQPLPAQGHFFQKSDTPRDQIKDLIGLVLSVIENIDVLIFQPLLAEQTTFLDQLAANIVSLHQLTLIPSTFSLFVTDSRKVVNNILTCKVFVEKFQIDISLLDASKDYRKNKRNKELLMLIAQSFHKEPQRSRILSQELKILANDLIAEMENI